MELKCTAPVDKKGAIKIEYKDFAGMPRRAIVSSNGGTAPSLVAYYKFNGNTQDSSGLGNNCTLVGNAQISGNALSLDGDNDYANCGNNSSLNLQGSLTLIAWLNPVQFPAGNFSRFIDKGCYGATCTAFPKGAFPG